MQQRKQNGRGILGGEQRAEAEVWVRRGFHSQDLTWLCSVDFITFPDEGVSGLATFRGWGGQSGCVVASSPQWIRDDNHRGMVGSRGVQEGSQQYLNKTIIERGLRVLIKVPKEVKNRELIMPVPCWASF